MLPTSSPVPACDSYATPCHFVDTRNHVTTGWMPLPPIGNSALLVPDKDGSRPTIMWVPVRIYPAISGLGDAGYSGLEMSRDDYMWMAAGYQESPVLSSVPELSFDDSVLHPWEETSPAPTDFQASLELKEDGTSIVSQSSLGEEILSMQFPPEAVMSTDQADTSSPEVLE